MMVLGIESSAHTLGIGVISDKDILVDERSVYIPAEGKGIIPREASQHHCENLRKILMMVLDKVDIKDIDVIAFTAGPGMPPCLRIGATVARCLALKYKKPLILVNHCVAHIEVGRFVTGCKDPVVLYLSGGNTQVIAFVEGRYRIFGETEDIPIGNALDMLAREIGLNMPGGPQIEKLAKKGKYIELPYVVKGMDLSFAGIVTEAVKKYKNGAKREDIAYSFQEVCFSMLTEVTERAMAHTDKEEVLLVGGVAANKRLQEMIRIMCEERGAKFYVVPQKYAGDNGVMIAVVGLLAYKKIKKGWRVEETMIKPKWRTDEVDIYW